MILAIDPGPEQSAYVLWTGNVVADYGTETNLEMLQRCYDAAQDNLPIVIEMIASYGMPVGAEVFETCYWIGRFAEAGCLDLGPVPDRITRLKIKNHLCHSSRANDANIRQAIIDRFGGKEKAIGKKAAPGPLYGISGDQWSALAVALTWWDQNGGAGSEARDGRSEREA